MERLEELTTRINEIANELENKNADYEKIRKDLKKIINFLSNLKKYLKKCHKEEADVVNDLLKRARKLQQQVSIESKPKDVEKKPKKEKVVTLRPEEIEYENIIHGNLDEEELIRVITINVNKINTILNSLDKKLQKGKLEYKNIELLLIKKSKKLKKDKVTVDKDFYKDLNNKKRNLKSIKDEIYFQRQLLIKYNSILVYLKNKNKKANYNHIKRDKQKIEKENKTYYNIIDNLLNDDKNYMFLKEVIENNPKFINARKNGYSIVFDILDKYIENLKKELINQKIVHQNPNYFLSLLKLFRNNSLDFTESEEKQFQERINELITYLNDKGYESKNRILTDINEIKSIKVVDNKQSIKIDIAYLQNYLQTVANMKSKRVNLKKEYLENVNNLVMSFQENNIDISDEEEISKNILVPITDIRNSKVIVETLAFEGSSYAISVGFSKNFEVFLRVHLLDTTYLYEESPCLKAINENINITRREVKKALKFKENNSYPVITYQFKIDKSNVSSSFKIYESTIKIDHVVKNNELKTFRSYEYLKSIIGYITILRNNYLIEEKPYSSQNITTILNEIINVELKNYVSSKNLPVLYFTELEMTSEEKMNLHNTICYYLSKIPKNEALDVYKTLENLLVNRYYSFESIDESKIDFIPLNQIGLLNTSIIKCSLKNNYEKIELYEYILRETYKKIKQEDLFIDYFNERKLIRQRKSALEQNRK